MRQVSGLLIADYDGRRPAERKIRGAQLAHLTFLIVCVLIFAAIVGAVIGVAMGLKV